jgi:FMN-dependent NADH-azoreductase
MDMTLLRVDSSIRHEGSVSRQVADSAEQAWRDEHSAAGIVVRRDLVDGKITPEAWVAAIAARQVQEADRTPAQQLAAELTTQLADEIIAADTVIVAAPLYNFGVSPHLKLWIDLLIADPRLAPGSEPVLAGKPLVLVVARGGGYGAGTPRAGWDHATPYLQRIFNDVFGMDVHLVEAELTLADVVPAMTELRPLAASLREQAHSLAADRGSALGARARAAVA